MEFTVEVLFFITFALFLASFVQGSIGFGFPMIATPIIAMVTDIKTAILYVAIPTLLVNVISIYSEKDFIKAIKKFYPLAIFAMIGSAIGTQILIYSNSEFFKLLLSFSILFYLYIQKHKIHFNFIKKYQRLSLVLFGIGAGIMGGLTNVMALVLIIYSLELNHSRKDIIQLANICFFFGKFIQIIIFILHDSFTLDIFEFSVASLIVVIIAMIIGINVKNRINESRYNKIIKVFLFLIAILLIVQTLY
ncbi:sulfite exporter TauE/SafE family protein [Aliarcobacter skirrowii]|uniref:sulfite exporter TauE/SafE family protein n=1 Tax=Aliarcobacter skirrowii TaxID=28200 RepID=UPI0029B95722|nr:sulfite exporter TauE/SafE family protein [Aliarcobacter skirrowii]MDX4034947.1 sulfite exporter TauE/SafE family protein [Aliarcobacter skirrowii]MDX4048771.1 sulfite exporter TauE/SafE family protein [Aliarcobacter skirrowii]